MGGCPYRHTPLMIAVTTPFWTTTGGCPYLFISGTSPTGELYLDDWHPNSRLFYDTHITLESPLILVKCLWYGFPF